ncbi:MAG: hypothetical protein AAF639_40160 [Chloroflexota bacterium]
MTDLQGALREHYDEEYGKYVNELNGDNITRQILYWSGLFSSKERPDNQEDGKYPCYCEK